MNDEEKYKEDILRQYINPESIEKAPEGFTSKVMTHIRMETVPLTATARFRKKNLVPVISAAVIILLLVAAFLIPDSQSDSTALPVLNLIKSIKSLLPELNLTSDFRLTLPSVMMYVFIGILVLTFFDRALYGIFHRQK
jgi:hypothetical protein